jgi:hypothetical protein
VPLPEHSSKIVETLRASWPSTGTGPIVGISIDPASSSRVRIQHLGPPIGSAGLQLLARSVDPVLAVEEDALLPVTAAVDDGAAWLAPAIDLLARLRGITGMSACVTLPPPSAPRAGRAAQELAQRAGWVRDQFVAAAGGRTDVVIAEGSSWSLEPRLGGCTL